MPRQPSADGDASDDGLYAEVAARLRRARLSRGLSLEQVSERTGVTTSFLGQVERGERKPSLRTVMLIARALKAPYEALLGDGVDGREGEKDAYRAAVSALLSGASAEQKQRALEMLRVLLKPAKRRRAA